MLTWPIQVHTWTCNYDQGEASLIHANINGEHRHLSISISLSMITRRLANFCSFESHYVHNNVGIHHVFYKHQCFLILMNSCASFVHITHIQVRVGIFSNFGIFYYYFNSIGSSINALLGYLNLMGDMWFLSVSLNSMALKDDRK